MRNRFILFLYTLVLLILLIAIWNPKVFSQQSHAELIVLLDESSSMIGVISPEILEQIAEVASQAGYTEKYFGFSDITYLLSRNREGRQLVPVSNTTAVVNVTNIAQALTFITKNQSSSMKNVILVISDFGVTSGDTVNALNVLKDSGTSVYAYQLKNPLPDASLEIVNNTHQANIGDTVLIPVRLKSNVNNNILLSLKVNGVELQEIQESISKDEALNHVFTYRVKEAGKLRIDVKLTADINDNSGNDNASIIINVNGSASILYVSKQASSHFYSTLLNVNQKIQNNEATLKHIFPGELFNEKLDQYTTLLLDNIHRNDLTSSDWKNIVDAVKLSGLNLLVTGGDNSFSLGAYRNSQLETVLPVISEPRKEEETLSLLFVIDKSGSMGQESSGHNLSSIAQQAVLNAIEILQKGDYLGLIAFDTNAKEYLALNKYINPARAINLNWQWSASGGTLLAPAISMAIERLVLMKTKRKFLILLTDGFVEDNWDQNNKDTLNPLNSTQLSKNSNIRQILTNNDIDLQIMAIGDNIDEQALKRLVDKTGGKMTGIEYILNLPKLMRSSIEKLRSPVRQGEISPTILSGIPLLADVNNIPVIDKYLVTREKTSGTVVMATNDNDPLFVYQFSGSGLVVVMMTDLNNWVNKWHSWSGWEKFSQDLINWVSGNQNRNDYIQIFQDSQNVNVKMDRVDENFRWSTEAAPEIMVSEPDGKIQNIDAGWNAPGQMKFDFPLSHPGEYTLNIRHGDSHQQLVFMQNSNTEYLSVSAADDNITFWAQKKLIIPLRLDTSGQLVSRLPSIKTRAEADVEFADSLAAKLAATEKPLDSRPYFIAMVIFLYLLLIIIERGVGHRLLVKRLKKGKWQNHAR